MPDLLGLPDAQPQPAHPTAVAAVTVDIVIPVFNEERALPGCVAALYAYLAGRFPCNWTITLVDNGSTDNTRAVATELADRLPGVRTMCLDRRGKGYALRTAWLASPAEIVAYMDVDLSTGLDALLPLIAPLVNGHSDLAIGSRLAPGSRSVRGLKREMISRAYNALVRFVHGAGFSDAQCGFKAARSAMIRPLLDRVVDDAWFFDTELLLLAEHNGLRVHEVPVDWVEDTDSRVTVVSVAAGNLRGLLRLALAKVSGMATITDLPAKRAMATSWVLCLVLSALSTVAGLVLYTVLRLWSPPLAANLVAVCLTARIEPQGTGGRRHLPGFLLLYIALTSGALLLLGTADHRPSRLLELGVLLAASAVGTVARFAAVRRPAPRYGKESLR